MIVAPVADASAQATAAVPGPNRSSSLSPVCSIYCGLWTGVERVSVKAVREALLTAVFVVVFAIVIGVVFLVREWLEAAGLQWPSALDTALSVLVGFVELVMTLRDIVRPDALIAIIIIIITIIISFVIIILFALGGVFRETGR
jgi:hypothetical protein